MQAPTLSPEAPVEPPPLPQPRFALGTPALVVLGVTALLTLMLSVVRGPREPAGVVAQIGSFALVFLLAMGLARLAWRLDSRRRGGGGCSVS